VAAAAAGLRLKESAHYRSNAQALERTARRIAVALAFEIVWVIAERAGWIGFGLSDVVGLLGPLAPLLGPTWVIPVLHSVILALIVGMKLFVKQSGGFDYGLEFNANGVVWSRTEHERYPIAWSNIGRISTIAWPRAEVFNLIDPVQPALGRGRLPNLDVIPFGHYERH